MKIYATSDLHGLLPDPPPDADALLIAGDICPDFIRAYYSVNKLRHHKGAGEQSRWLQSAFKPWVQSFGGPVVITWGNHDFAGEMLMLWPQGVPSLTVLVDEGTKLGDLTVWGTPWVPGLPFWAFHASEEALAASTAKLPPNVDVFMTHGPPHMSGADRIPGDSRFNASPSPIHVGSSATGDIIRARRPALTICGHIHEGRGAHKLDGEHDVWNVAAVDENYVLHNNPWVELPV